LPQPQAARPQAQPFQSPSTGGGMMWLLVVILLGALGTGGWFIWKHFAGPDVTITAFPQKIHVAAGGRTVVQASVSGSSDADVTWSIKEGAAGGTITPRGSFLASGQARAGAVYSAPQTAGTYHVIATSHANSSRSATIEVIVGGNAQNPFADSQPTSGASGSAYASQIVGSWRGPTSDITTTIGNDGTIAMNSDSDPQKNLHGTYKFTDSSHLQVDFGNGDTRTWQILDITGRYLRVVSQSKDGAAALVFGKM
jgi:hypothetical protein